MGLLDDAIKEHLELKRRRGADPAEIEREAHEALDPPGTEPVAPEPVAAETPAPEPVAAEAVAAPEPTPVPEPVAAEPPISSAPLTEEPAYTPPPEPAAAPDPPFVEPPEADAPHHEAQPPTPPPAEDFDMEPAPPVEAATVHQPTAEFAIEDVQDAIGETHVPPPAAPPEDAEEPADPDDVLEETPEFLQETPEHDRLWFEQKPPRDFDF